MSAPTRPVLRYHGGKWRLAPWIISHFPAHRIYVEPYGGAASVLIRKPRAYAEVYNDLDGETVNVFRVLRNAEQAAELERQLRLTPFARDEFKQSYAPSDDPVEQARRTILRSMAGFGSGAATGHNTGFRANSDRSGTTPARDWANYPNLVSAYTERLAGVVIENRPAAEIMAQHDGPETLHYIDPPYTFETRAFNTAKRTGYNKLYRHEMDTADHRALAATLHGLQGMVVLSGYGCDLYDVELYPDWRRVEVSAMADGASERTEVLWLSPAAAQAQLVLPLFSPTGAAL